MDQFAINFFYRQKLPGVVKGTTKNLQISFSFLFQHNKAVNVPVRISTMRTLETNTDQTIGRAF
jgi:hypothetical protein